MDIWIKTQHASGKEKAMIALETVVIIIKVVQVQNLSSKMPFRTQIFFFFRFCGGNTVCLPIRDGRRKEEREGEERKRE